MSGNEQAIVFFMLVLSPVVGVTFENLLLNAKFRNLKKLRLLPVICAVCAGAVLLINFALLKFDANNEILITSMNVFDDFRTSFILTPQSALISVIVSASFLIGQFLILNFHVGINSQSKECDFEKINNKGRSFFILSNLSLFALQLCVFSGSHLVFIFGLSLMSVAYLVLPSEKNSSKQRMFFENLIYDFILIFIILILSDSKSISFFWSIILLGTILGKGSLLPFSWHKKFEKAENRILFSFVLRPAIILVMIINIRNFVDSNVTTAIMLIALLSVIVLRWLISLLRTSDSFQLIEQSFKMSLINIREGIAWFAGFIYIMFERIIFDYLFWLVGAVTCWLGSYIINSQQRGDYRRDFRIILFGFLIFILIIIIFILVQ